MADFTRLALFTIAENAGWVRGQKVSRALARDERERRPGAAGTAYIQAFSPGPSLIITATRGR